jgi:hypothetical protein
MRRHEQAALRRVAPQVEALDRALESAAGV